MPEIGSAFFWRLGLTKTDAQTCWIHREVDSGTSGGSPDVVEKRVKAL